MKAIITTILVLTCWIGTSSVLAEGTRYWIPVEPTSNWHLMINNNVIYIVSADFPSHCSHSRAQINIMADTPLDKAYYSYLLAAYQAKQAIRVVVKNSQSTCVVSGVSSS